MPKAAGTASAECKVIEVPVSDARAPNSSAAAFRKWGRCGRRSGPCTSAVRLGGRAFGAPDRSAEAQLLLPFGVCIFRIA
ncbi:MAG: hypothetical protein KDB94_06070, partial [Acidobacteria bacterium]|nr:hypothetical protein [Acidobacteriota bacterium]